MPPLETPSHAILIVKRKQRAPNLSLRRQKKIATLHTENPALTHKQIATMTGATERQVQIALEKYVNGELTPVPRQRKAAKKAISNLVKKDADTLFENTYKHVLAELNHSIRNDPAADAKETALTLEKLYRSRKLKYDTDVQSHLTGLDWRVYCETVRMLSDRPINDHEIIHIYNEAKARCKTADTLS